MIVPIIAISMLMLFISACSMNQNVADTSARIQPSETPVVVEDPKSTTPSPEPTLPKETQEPSMVVEINKPIAAKWQEPYQDGTIQVNHSYAFSLNGLYCAESYGANTGVTANGLYPAEGYRVIELSRNRKVWDMPGYYDHSFLWSEDGNTLAITYWARVYSHVVFVNMEDCKEIDLSYPEEIKEKMHDDRPDSYFVAEEWVDNTKVRISYKFVGQDNLTYSGSFIFSPETQEISDFQMEEGSLEG